MTKLSQCLIGILALVVAILFASCSTEKPVGHNPTESATHPVETVTVTVAPTTGSSPAADVSPAPKATNAVQQGNQQEKGALAKAPKVEVVFVLDTTGSMSGLIEGAKQKIWSIANTILQAEPKPIIKFGLIGYRDKGDAYVTKVYGLSDNMDTVYENLMQFEAGGGGDTPEHVSKALSDALNEIQWTKGKNVLRITFLVGDAPPHVDYQDGYNYKKICGEARQRDIFINTIRCGNDSETEKYWNEIASLGSGKYASIDQSGGMVAIDTPMDKELADLNVELGRTLVAFGSSTEREEVMERQSKSEAYAPSVQAERAKLNAGSLYVDKKDLVDAVKNKEVSVGELSVAELPEEMQTMDKNKREKYVTEQARKRDDLKKKINDVSKKRDQYIQDKQRENKGSFDSKVVSFIKEQARTKGLTIK